MSIPRSYLHLPSLGAALLFLQACPQLLDDSFEPELGPKAVPAAGGAGAGGDGSEAGGANPAGGNGNAGANFGAGGDFGLPSCDQDEDACCVQGGEGCIAAAPWLKHRYSFEGLGTTATDSVSGAHGEIVATTLSGSGSVVLLGARSGQYVDLPNGIISSLGDATFEIWLSWSGGDIWQRIFDFGSTTSGENATGTGSTYLFLSPAAQFSSVFGSPGPLRVTFTATGYSAEVSYDVSPTVPLNTVNQLVLVIDETTGRLAVYRQGEPKAWHPFDGKLSMLDDVNNWLGRSQYNNDYLGATLLEFRIYDTALSDPEVLESFRAGPDTLRVSQ